MIFSLRPEGSVLSSYPGSTRQSLHIRLSGVSKREQMMLRALWNDATAVSLLLLRFPRSRSFSICTHSGMIGRNYRTMAHSLHLLRGTSIAGGRTKGRTGERCQKPKALPNRRSSSISYHEFIIDIRAARG